MANDQWENAARLYLGPRVYDILSLASFPCQTSDRVSDRVPLPSQDQGYRVCVRECTPVSTTFGSLSLVTGSSGFGHKVVNPFWKRGSVYGLETSRSLEGGCFWHCLGLVILFFYFFFLHFRFRKGILRPERLWFSMRVFFFFFL